MTRSHLGEQPTLDPGAAKSSAAVSAERIAPGSAVLLRTAFPAEAAPGLSRQSDAVLERIRSDEREREDNVSNWAHFSNFVSDHAIAVSAALLGASLAALGLMAWQCRERPTEVSKYLPEPPQRIPPALAYAYATEGEFDRDAVLLATLLDLVDRGYYNAATPVTESDPDLVLSVPTERPSADDLADYELATIDFFDRLLGSDELALSKLADKVPRHSSSWRRRFEDLSEALDKAEDGELTWDRDLVGERRLLLLLAMIGFAILTAAYLTRTRQFRETATAAAIAGALIYLLKPQSLKRLEPRSRQLNAEWSAFRRWTDDFPNLDDDPPATLKLWRQILIYAVAFGTARKVLESGRIPAPVLEEAGGSGSYWYFSGANMLWLGSAGSFSSGFASHVAPQASSGGGGFSGGGGGGFSGGGGGGAW